MIVIARNRPSTSPANVEPLSGSHQCMRLSPRLVHLAAKLKSAVLVSLPATVTVAVCAPYFSCHASIVYVPGGRPLISKLPSPPLKGRSEEHTSELQSRGHLVCRLLLEKKK